MARGHEQADPLATGSRAGNLDVLGGRAAFIERVAAALPEALASGGRIAVLVLDLNRMREINFSAGYALTDRLLTELARRLATAMRARDVIARMGGDEFAILLPDVLSEDHAMLAARKVRRVAEVPYALGENAVPISVSVGVAVAPDHATGVDGLLGAAERALFRAKAGGSGIEVARPGQRAGPLPRYLYEQELKRAIEQNTLELYFQPKIECATGELRGAEALLRWNHPELGPIEPAVFVPVAERSEVIHPLTLWVLNVALRNCAAWHERGHRLSVAVNLSTRNLDDLELPDLLLRALETWRLDARYLALEITETAAMDDRENVNKVLQRLQQLGLQVSIDDFGSGFSSMAYLRRLPVHELKIDKEFVSTMCRNRDSELIVQAIIQLARSFGLMVTAEGVEDAETLERLKSLGCDMAQGFYIARPMPSAQFARRVYGADGSGKQ